MSRNMKILLCALIIFLVLSFSNAFASKVDTGQSGQHEELPRGFFELPLSLTVIEDEAFEGVSAAVVRIPENAVKIGNSAFANIPTLRKIELPDSVEWIGKDAFKGSNQVVITGTPRGYARAWAAENGIPFSPVVSLYTANLSDQITGLSDGKAPKSIIDGEHEENNKPGQGRYLSGELSEDPLEGAAVFHIFGRAPPVC